MIKEEILKAMRNYSSEIKTCIAVKAKADEIKAVLDQWPSG